MAAIEKLSVPVSLDSLSKLRQYVKDACSSTRIDKARAYNLQLAVDEIATNIITHGSKGAGPGGELSIRGELTDKSLIITLEDNGPAFDPRNRELPDEADLAKPLEERSIGGLGIFLALKGVDRFDYRRVGNRNLNVLEVDVL